MKKSMLVVMLATMVVATIPGLAQDGEFNVTPAADEPVSTCER